MDMVKKKKKAEKQLNIVSRASPKWPNYFRSVIMKTTPGKLNYIPIN